MAGETGISFWSPGAALIVVLPDSPAAAIANRDLVAAKALEEKYMVVVVVMVAFAVAVAVAAGYLSLSLPPFFSSSSSSSSPSSYKSKEAAQGRTRLVNTKEERKERSRLSFLSWLVEGFRRIPISPISVFQIQGCGFYFPQRVRGMMNTASSSSATNGSADGVAPRRNSKRPKYSKFTQQELPACKPILTPQWVISVFVLISIIFVPIGIASLLASRDVVEIIYRYDNECVPKKFRSDKEAFIKNGSLDKSCKEILTVPKKMKQPIYVYYELDNFYQNHRRYVKSRNDMQLRDPKKANDMSNCDPESNNGGSIVPCGLIAWSLFNDTYTLTVNNRNLTINKKGISWKSDRDHKFGDKVFPKNFQSGANGSLIGGAKLNDSIPLSEQEDLIVWMRTAALPTFRKLYGKIQEDLEVNTTITVTLMNNYNTYSFSGKKKLVLSTTSWLGGKNDFLGIAYLTVGGLCFFLATAFTVVYLVKPRKLGDPSYLSWNRTPGGQM